MTEQHPFTWRHFQSDLIVLCVGWYLRYPVRYRHLARDDARTGLFGRSPHHLSLGAALYSGSGKTVPTSGERNNRLLAQRFKQIAGSGQKENDIGDNYTARRDDFQKECYREKGPATCKRRHASCPDLWAGQNWSEGQVQEAGKKV